jgi:hypothetical protein
VQKSNAKMAETQCFRDCASQSKYFECTGFFEIDNGELKYMEMLPDAAEALIELAKTVTLEENEEIDDGLLILSPRPADYDPLAPREQAMSLQELRLKREAAKVANSNEPTQDLRGKI